MTAKKSRSDVWWLGAGSEYRDRPNQGCFSPLDLVSSHSFGWDTKAQGFVVKDELGIAGTVHHRLSMPVELAEAFLLRCLDPKFRELFLTSAFPREDAEETIEAGGAKLKLHRSKAEPVRGSQRYYMPGLTLSIEKKMEGSPERVFLFHEMRINFGARIGKLTMEEVQTSLRIA
jgi:hypothetical protein